MFEERQTDGTDSAPTVVTDISQDCVDGAVVATVEAMEPVPDSSSMTTALTGQIAAARATAGRARLHAHEQVPGYAQE